MAQDVDGVLVQWGDRLFYPGNRIVKVQPQPRLKGAQRAAYIRARLEAAVRRAPQVMVKVTGGGRGMKAIAAHLRYISKNGRLEIEDELGRKSQGREAVQELAEEWRYAGSLIPEVSDRREAFNIMLSMPRGVDALTVQRAAREFAELELADHKYVMVLHEHQANPHVHLSVRAESRNGKRLNPRKADFLRWREVFAERLRGWGIEAEATRRATRGVVRRYEPIWRVKARAEHRLRVETSPHRAAPALRGKRLEAVHAWARIGRALASSGNAEDVRLARSISAFVHEMPGVPQRVREQTEPARALQPSRGTGAGQSR